MTDMDGYKKVKKKDYFWFDGAQASGRVTVPGKAKSYELARQGEV